MVFPGFKYDIYGQKTIQINSKRSEATRERTIPSLGVEPKNGSFSRCGFRKGGEGDEGVDKDAESICLRRHLTLYLLVHRI